MSDAENSTPYPTSNAPENDRSFPVFEREWPYKRRVKLPVVLFLLTCLSTFFVGATQWLPLQTLIDAMENQHLLYVRQLLIANWDDGLIYMSAVILILLMHEFGHFFATLIYRVPASFPIFLPFPINPLGTLGAVIGMRGNSANRKEIFDIGIAGPLAGLVAAIPLAWFGVSQLDLSTVPHGGLGFRLPLLMQWFAESAQVPGYQAEDPTVWISQLNPVFTAAWVGMLITGLNMMPVGQLDGGHITYTLFGRAAHWLARALIILAVAFMVFYQTPMLIVMVGLLLLIGTDHPPTTDDSIKIGPFRWVLGLASLSIPFLCFPPLVFKIVW